MTLNDLLTDPFSFPRREEVDDIVDQAMLCIPESRSDLISRVSHAIRTPLAAILGFNEILEMDVALSEADKSSYREILESETHRLRRFIRSLQVFQALLKGSVGDERATQDVRQTISTAVSHCELDARKKTVRLELIRSDRDVPLDADHVLLRLAMEQLLLNSIRATSAHGIIDIETIVRKKEISVVVEDTGYGMDPAEIEKLFKPFQRIARPDDSGGELGIGLTIVRSIIEHHEGAISIESAPMDGSRVTLTLPR